MFCSIARYCASFGGKPAKLKLMGAACPPDAELITADEEAPEDGGPGVDFDPPDRVPAAATAAAAACCWLRGKTNAGPG